MTRKQWSDIQAAADLLGLGESATLAEIKKAYRRLSMKHHPDMGGKAEPQDGKVAMHSLTEAYQTLLAYCAEYSFPLIPDENAPQDPEDWWFERFGQDHLWGKGDTPKGNSEK